MQDHAYRAASSGGNPIEPEMNPNDVTPVDTPTVGDDVCPKCTGSGLRDDGMPCEHCGGTGRVTSDVHGV